MSTVLFSVATTCRLLSGYQRFGGMYCRHVPGEDRGDVFLRYVGNYQHDHTFYNTGETHVTSSLPRGSQVWGHQEYSHQRHDGLKHLKWMVHIKSTKITIISRFYLNENCSHRICGKFPNCVLIHASDTVGCLKLTSYLHLRRGEIWLIILPSYLNFNLLILLLTSQSSSIHNLRLACVMTHVQNASQTYYIYIINYILNVLPLLLRDNSAGAWRRRLKTIWCRV